MCYWCEERKTCLSCGKPLNETKGGDLSDSGQSTGSIPAWVQDEIKATWNAARDSGNQHDSFRIIERMTDRLGYGRLDNNPSLAE